MTQNHSANPQSGRKLESPLEILQGMLWGTSVYSRSNTTAHLVRSLHMLEQKEQMFGWNHSKDTHRAFCVPSMELTHSVFIELFLPPSAEAELRGDPKFKSVLQPAVLTALEH